MRVRWLTHLNNQRRWPWANCALCRHVHPALRPIEIVMEAIEPPRLARCTTDVALGEDGAHDGRDRLRSTLESKSRRLTIVGTCSVKMFPRQVCSPLPKVLYTSRGRQGSTVSGFSNTSGCGCASEHFTLYAQCSRATTHIHVGMGQTDKDPLALFDRN